MAPTDRFESSGLTEVEARHRQSLGQDNRSGLRPTQSYWEIIRANVFTFINNVLFILGGVLISLGRVADAVVAVGVILINVVVSVIQEIRAKHTLERIALLTRPTATVRRDNQERELAPEGVVLGDVLVIRAGDQLVADGEVLGGAVEMDESLLTGESDPIPKQNGDTVFSGSFCVSGDARVKVTQVGEASVANRLAAGARQHRRVLTPLQQDTHLMIRAILLMVVYLAMVRILAAIADGDSLVTVVQHLVVIAGMVPNGLFLAIAVAYALGAVRMARRGALVQRANAVDSLSNVDLLCLDKTGTLTAGRIRFECLLPTAEAPGDEASLRQALGDFAATKTAPNATDLAIGGACEGCQRRVVAEVAFSSAWKWSGYVFDDPGRRQTLVLGAPEVLAAAVPLAPELLTQARDWAAMGLRVLLLAGAPTPLALRDGSGQPLLPSQLQAWALLALADEIREDAPATLAAFREAGVRLKVISGDNPDTVASLATRAGLGENLRVLSGPELASMDYQHAHHAIAETSVFGRITPAQKADIITSLRDQGNYVAMVGDGVNDVLALKQANLGIAMQSGSQAARATADIVLLGDAFEVLPYAVQEGQRIVTGMMDILRLYMSRLVYTLLLVVSVGMIGGFPFVPTQNGLLALLAVGIPSVALAAWARPEPLPPGHTVQRIMHFTLGAGLSLAVFGLGLFAFYSLPTEALGFWNSLVQGFPSFAERAALVENRAQTALTVFLVICSLLLVVFVEPPSRAWVGGTVYSGDRRPALLALGLALVLGLILGIPPLRAFFTLAPLAWWDHLLILALAGIWALVARWLWRWRLLDRLLRVDAGFAPQPREP